MGFVLSRFRKPGDSPSTKLEAINKELAQIECYRKQNLARQKTAVASLVIYSILIYLVAAILYFVYYFPELKLLDKCIHSLPLLLFPLIVYGIKKFLHWYFVKRITENDLKLADLKEEKNKIHSYNNDLSVLTAFTIEDVMENETYKKATEILEKYAPNRLHKLNESKDSTSGMCTPDQSRLQSSPGTELRLRSVAAAGAMSSGGRYQSGAPTPAPAFNKTLQQLPPGVTPTPGSKITMQQRSMYGAPPGPPLPRQVLPRDRSYMDKLFESLVGDGPQSRYALICKYCQSHNGMALPEEFEYLGFRCCYCFHMNEARKLRPNAPRLNLDTTVGSSSDEGSAAADPLLTDSEATGDEEEEEEILAGNIDTAGVISSSSGEPHRGGSNGVAQPATDDRTDHSDGDK